MSDKDEAEATAEADMALAFFDGHADVWAANANITGMIKNVMHVARLSKRAPDDVREKFIDRAEAQFDAIVRQAFVEGAMHALMRFEELKADDA